MNITVKENARIGEKYYYMKHRSGLDIYVIPKKLTSAYALFCTRYGAVDNCFRLESEADFTRVPDGIAHYLEHKMFENEDGVDTFSRFAAYGASANAFTSMEVTAYLFKCTENFDKNLEILLDYVTHPYFTSENVQKERGIIAQEIRGREDWPEVVQYMNLLRALYERSQAKIRVAGTVESIQEIDAKLLYKCYEVFYNLSNMFLCVAGDVTPEQVLAVADKMLPVQEEKKIERHYDREGRDPVKKYAEEKFEVAKPMFLLGVKDGFFSENARENQKRRIAMELITETLFGYSSEFAVDVYESGLIDELYADYSSVVAAGSFFMFGGESNDVDAAIAKFKEYTEEVKARGIDEESFERARKFKYAAFVRSFEGTGIAEEFAMSLIKSSDYFDTGDIIAEITLDEANAIVRELFDEKYYAVSVIKPIEKENE